MGVTVERILVSQFTIKVGGSALSTELFEDVVELLVDSNRHLPDMVQITFNSAHTGVMDDATFKIGAPIEVNVDDNNGASHLLFKGEITALEAEFTEEHHPLLIVRGYDKSHRLHRGKKNTTHLKMKDSAVVQKLAGNAGLSADVDTTKATHEYILQYHQTDMEFIRALARRNGFEVYVEKERLYFKKPAPPSSASVELTWGTELLRFRPRVAASHQVNEVTVKGWAPQQKEAVEGTVTSATNKQHQGGESKDGAAVAKSAFGDAQSLDVNLPVTTPDEAKEMAQAIFNRMNSDFVTAEGLCTGTPTMKAGAVVDIQGVGTRFGGTYVLTTVTHIYRPEEGYKTEFTVHGQQEDVLSYILDEGGNGHGGADSLLGGVVPAVVTNIDDSDNLGRVKVKYPWLDDQLESHWLRLVAPGAGAERGTLNLPEVNDEVLVAFERGDLSSAYVLGGLWNGQDKLPEGIGTLVESGKVNERIIRSRTGHLIVFSDKQGEEQILIRDKTGKNEIIIDSKQNDITINVDNNYTLAAKGVVQSTSDKETKVTSKGNMTLQASGGSNVEMKGTNITIKGQSNIAVEATGNLDLKANGQLNIQGTQVAIKGSAMVQVQGAMVKIN
jgi:phage protein D/phage baseplate assembly protein gpV